jgi:anti-anti-sigma factor
MFSFQSDDGEVACVAISGQVRQEDILRAGDPLEDVLGTGPYGRKVLLDLSGLEVIDSSGFSLLVRWQKRMCQSGGQLILHSASPRLGQTLGRLKMDLILCITGDRETAIRLARSHGRDVKPR